MTAKLLLSLALALSFSSNARADVFSNVPETAVENYQVLYQLDLPVNAGFRDTTAIPYSVDNSASATPFDRVAYYLELTLPDSSVRWAYASMDAFTTNAKALGVPHSSSNPVVHQRTVGNLNVFSNVAGVTTGAFLEGGNIEFWPSDYSQGNSIGIFAAAANSFDRGDGGASSAAGYGSFQVHNSLARQTVFAWNRWGNADSTNDDVGIGNQATGNPDWTFAGNTASYTVRRLVILTRPAVPRVTLTKFPRQRALIPRDIATNDASVPIEGTEPAGGYDNIVLRTYRNGVFQNEISEALVYPSQQPAAFSFAPRIPAELASYDFELLLEKNGQRTVIKRASDIVAGDVYLIYGQSNSEAARSYSTNNTSSAAYNSPWVRTFGQNSDSGDNTKNALYWVNADGDGAGSNYSDPGAVGQWGIVLGRKIVDTYSVPVAVMNGGRGGYTMAQLAKDDADPDNLYDTGTTTRRTYNRLRYRMIQGGLTAKARALFYYQGESDNGNAAVHAAGFQALMDDWAVDYPTLEKIYEVQVHVGCGVTRESTDLRNIQRLFGDVYPNVTLMSTNGLQAHDGCHYTFINGYETLGQNLFRQVSRDFYSGPPGADIDPLNPLKAEFTDANRNAIRLTLRNAGATVNFPSGALADFVLSGTSATITGYTVNGNIITFPLSGTASGNVTLQYLGHNNGGAFVTNANGVGLLTFQEPVAAASAPSIRLNSPTSSREAAVGETLNVSASGIAGPSAPVASIEFRVNNVIRQSVSGSTLETSWTPTAAGAYVLEVTAVDTNGARASAKASILVGASATPGGVTNGLNVWLKAEAGVTLTNGRVSAWQNQIADQYHVSQSTASSMPGFGSALLGNRMALAFDGSRFLSSAAGMPTGDYTKIVRFALTNYSSTNNLVSANGTGTGFHALFFNASDKPLLFHGATFVSSPTAVPLNAARVITATYQASNKGGTLFLDNGAAATGTAANHNSLAGYQIGAVNGGYFLNGLVTDVLIYNRVLSQEERTAVYNDLISRDRTPFQNWQITHPSATTYTSDPANDGITAVVEYALGLEPAANNSDSSRLPKVSIENGHLSVSYQRAISAADVVVELHSSDDLLNWAKVEDVSSGISGDLETRVYSPAGSSPQKFFRLRVLSP